jgi:hypothetical protein
VLGCQCGVGCASVCCSGVGFSVRGRSLCLACHVSCLLGGSYSARAYSAGFSFVLRVSHYQGDVAVQGAPMSRLCGVVVGGAVSCGVCGVAVGTVLWVRCRSGSRWGDVVYCGGEGVHCSGGVE